VTRATRVARPLLARASPLEPLRYRDFRLLWFGQGGSGIGYWMDQVARGWLMYELTDSALQLGLVTAIRAIPLFLLSPVAGVWADRYRRKRLLVASQTVNVAFFGALAILIFGGSVQPWHVYLAALGTAIAQVFEGPARQAMLPETVPATHLTNAIGLNSIVFNSSRTVGPAVAGMLISAVGSGGSYSAQALIYALCVFWTLQIGEAGASAQRHPGRRASVLSSTLEGWRFIAGNETVRASMMITATTALLAVPFITLLPIFAKDVLDVGATGQGLFLAAMGVGALLSAVLLATVGDRLFRGPLMLGGAVLYGVSLLGFAGSPWFVISLVLLTAAGLANVACNALVQSVVQAATPSALRGRVMAVFLQRELLTTLGGLLAGALAALLSAPAAVALMAGACLALSVGIALVIPAIREIH